MRERRKKRWKWEYYTAITDIFLNKLKEMMLNIHYQRKKGSQQAKNADMMIPSVLAAFRSLFILLLLAIGGSSGCGSGDDWSTVGRDVRPAEIPLICRCLFNRAAATLLLKHKINIELLYILNNNCIIILCIIIHNIYRVLFIIFIV